MKYWVNSFPGFASWTIALQILPFLWLHLSIQCIKLKYFQCVPCIILNLITHKAWGYVYLDLSFITNGHFSAINQKFSLNPLAHWNENFWLYLTSMKNSYGKNALGDCSTHILFAYSLPSAKWLLLSKTVWQQQTLCSSHLLFPNLFKYCNEQRKYFFPITKLVYHLKSQFQHILKRFSSALEVLNNSN